MKKSRVGDASGEFENAAFGDVRLTRRLMRIADGCAARAASGFPEIAGSDGELEGVYRFLGNERVTPARIFAPHFAAAAKRAGTTPVVVAHDTTELSFGGAQRREGLGRVGQSKGAQGFFAHFAVAFSGDGSRRPLGVLGLKPIVRDWRVSRVPKGQRDNDPDNSESIKWTELAIGLRDALPQAVHVMDREADSFTIMSRLIDADVRFVIRLCRDRTLGGGEKMFEAAGRGEIFVTRSVPISRRKPHRSKAGRKINPPRAERTAKLQIRASTLALPRPKRQRYVDFPPTIIVNVVVVEEVETPVGETPVSWFLMTTDPIDTTAQVEEIVDAYRVRWGIEEFFKALKTGCSIEKRQLESLRTLVNALAVFSVIAWRMLLLRWVARATPDAPASDALTSRQVRLLDALGRMPEAASRLKLKPLPSKPTAHDVLLAVASIGGHIKNNGDPGWMVIGRGYESLLLVELGWRAHDRESQSSGEM